MAYKIDQEHDKCIGCGACVAVCSDNWEMKDNKAVPKKTDLTEDELECNKEAAEACPVKCIKIEKV